MEIITKGKLEYLNNKIYNCCYSIIKIVPVLCKDLIDCKKQNTPMYNKNNILLSLKSFFESPTHIVDNVYISSMFNVSNFHRLDRYNITDIIHLSNNSDNLHDNIKIFEGNYNYNHFIFENENISIYNINSIIDIIKKSMNNSLIYCNFGTNYSVFIMICYLIKIHNKTIEQCMDYINTQNKYFNFSEKLFEKLLDYYEYVQNYAIYENTEFIV